MEVKTFQNTYDLSEFHCYVTDCGDDCINVVELLISVPDTDDIEYIETDFANIFVVEAGRHTYVFSGYEVTEFYIEENGLVKVICVK